jgi:hypothetical protein
LIEPLRDTGLPYSKGGEVSGDAPLVQAVKFIINSPEGRAAYINGVEAGWPPIPSFPTLVKAPA